MFGTDFIAKVKFGQKYPRPRRLNVSKEVMLKNEELENEGFENDEAGGEFEMGQFSSSSESFYSIQTSLLGNGQLAELAADLATGNL